MPVEYVCAVNKGHIESCGKPQIPPPQCCGKPMVLARCLVRPAAAVQPAATKPGKPQAAPAGKPSHQPKTGTQKS
jgi:hypothetical protein